MAMNSIETLQKSSGPARLAELLSAAIETVLLWHERRCDRGHLASLDDRMLRDIGITQADVEREYRKPFWRT
jgi:uncharacterized protein YjiS (DUF1127 family)